MKRIVTAAAFALASIGAAPAAFAQNFDNVPTDRVLISTDAAYAYQADTGLEGGGSFSVNRYQGRLGALKAFDSGAAIGLNFSYGGTNYAFSNAATAPWGDVNDMGVSAFFTYQGDRGPRFVLVPSLRWNYENGAGADDGLTFGAFGGVAWQVAPSLSIGPGIGVFSRLDGDGVDIFPAVLLDWQITDALRLSTGGGLGASQGPGLNLDYALTDKFTVGLAGRYENNRFRLDNAGIAPGGIGEDRSFPLVATVSFKPYPAGKISAFAGIELGGELTARNAAGTIVQQRSYDAAPIFGVAAEFFF